jgi:hypothetical protein
VIFFIPLMLRSSIGFPDFPQYNSIQGQGECEEGSMRMGVLMAIGVMLASCTTAQTAATNTGTGQQASTTEQREAPPPPAFRAPRQKSGVGWPDLGYRHQGN